MNPPISHKFVRPYNRQKAKENLTAMVMDYFNDNNQQEHPLNFCAGIYICAYASANCQYGMKKCYFE